jgi:hypothetical protein
MPTDEELQIAKVFRTIFPKNNITKFYIIPPPEIRKIGSVLVGDPTELIVQDTSNLSEGLFIFAEFIPSGTSIVSIVGNTITMSASASEAFTNRDIIFYSSFEDGLLPLKVGQTIGFV